MTITNDLTVTGNFTVNGTTVTINATTLTVDDKNIENWLGTTPTDTTGEWRWNYSEGNLRTKRLFGTVQIRIGLQAITGLWLPARFIR